MRETDNEGVRERERIRERECDEENDSELTRHWWKTISLCEEENQGNDASCTNLVLFPFFFFFSILVRFLLLFVVNGFSVDGQPSLNCVILSAKLM